MGLLCSTVRLLLLLLLQSIVLPYAASKYSNLNGFVAPLLQPSPHSIRNTKPPLESIDDDDGFGFFLPLESNLLYIQLGIGNPPRLFTFSLDSTTPLPWLECPQRYDPRASSTSAPLPCTTNLTATSVNISLCSPPLFCTSSQSCGYDIVYGDDQELILSRAAGNVVSDTLHVFPSISDPSTTFPFPGFLFGCGTITRMPEETDNIGIDGRLSLTTHPLSLLSQLRISRFSHCLWPSSTTLPHNYIRFGLMAEYDGKSTTGGVVSLLNVTGSYLYHVALLGISVGHTRLIDHEFFNTRRRRSLAIDIGTFYTRLEADVYDMVKEQLLMQIGPTIFNGGRYEVNGMMCFPPPRDMTLKMETLPVITLHLELFNYSISNKGVYIQDGPAAICAAFIRSSMNVLGASALSDYAVGYDTLDRKISFLQKDCLTDFVDGL